MLNKNGVPETIRTSDPLIKSQLLCQLSYEDIPDGADYRNRTHNLLITSQLLYQLSYFGKYGGRRETRTPDLLLVRQML